MLVAEDDSVFAFRNLTANDLRTFFVKTGGGNGQTGPLYIDDIYLENTSSLNLSNPATVITSTRSPQMFQAYALEPNYPNPFNPVTTIAFDLPSAQMVELCVYALDGRLVSRLVSGMMPAGRHEVIWNGRSGQGKTVASGTYLYRITAGTFTDTRRMVLIK
jgi:hypothetical protein